jgi:hypothetical protein
VRHGFRSLTGKFRKKLTTNLTNRHEQKKSSDSFVCALHSFVWFVWFVVILNKEEFNHEPLEEFNHEPHERHEQKKTGDCADGSRPLFIRSCGLCGSWFILILRNITEQGVFYE